ncbi:MAG: ABC transporter ATP-binding protein [Oscillospiraceae bacterium]
MLNEKRMKITKSPLLKSATKGSGRYFLIGSLSVVGVALASYAIPIVVSFTVDYILNKDASQLPFFLKGLTKSYSSEYFADKLYIPAAALVVLSLFSVGFTYLRGKCTARASEDIAMNMKNSLYSHIQDLPYDYHKHTSTGDLVQRCTSDVETIRRFIGTQLLEVVKTIVMVIVALIVMLSLNVKMSLISVSLMPFLALSALLYFSKIREYFVKSDEAEGALSTFIQENVSGVRVVRAFGQQKAETEAFAHFNDNFRQKTAHLMTLLAKFWGGSDSLGYCQICLTTVACAYYAVRGEMTVGTVMVFITYTSMLVWPIRQLGRIVSEMGKASISLERLEEIMSAEVENETGKALKPKIKGEVEFKNVCFGYECDNDVLDDISFKVAAGQTVAILGTTGSGKTSLVHLLQRLYRCNRGEILIDGININDIDRNALRSSIGLVMQEPFLYSRSIFDNIKIVNSGAADNEVYEAARISSVHEVISEFENGYETIVGERGVTLSGGQKQRVAIARMLMKDYSVLIFDDSMSAVDTETDAAIRKALSVRREGITTFIISHRVTTLREADFIIVLENGKITESGTHAELIENNGTYARITRAQSAYVDVDEQKGCDCR